MRGRRAPVKTPSPFTGEATMSAQKNTPPGPDQPISRTLISPERFGQIDPRPVRMLKEAGVECIFTLSGGHVMAIYDGCLDEGIKQ